MMRYLLIIFVFLQFNYSFSQEKLDKVIDNVKEIHFVYKKKSNYIINDEGVFADTLLFQIDFPDTKYILKKHPSDSTVICGFSPHKGFGNNNRKKLKSIIYHSNETINAIHYVVSKKTIFNVVRGDDETKLIFKKYFRERFYNFGYRQEFDFVKKIEKITYPRVSYEHEFSKISKKIEFIESQNHGFYSSSYGDFIIKNLVFFNKRLPKFVSPILFVNNEFGIEKIKNIDVTIELKSVYYK